MDAVAAEAVPRIHEFSQQNLSNLCWAFGKVGHFNSKLVAAIAERSIVLVKVLCVSRWVHVNLRLRPAFSRRDLLRCVTLV